MGIKGYTLPGRGYYPFALVMDWNFCPIGIQQGC